MKSCVCEHGAAKGAICSPLSSSSSALKVRHGQEKGKHGGICDMDWASNETIVTPKYADICDENRISNGSILLPRIRCAFLIVNIEVGSRLFKAWERAEGNRGVP